MHIIKNKILLILIFSICAIASEIGGPPMQSELTGYWKMIEFPDPKKNKVNPWPLPNQWYAFYEDGKLNSVMSSNDEKISVKELKETFSTFSKTESPKYELKGQFIIVEYPNIKNYKQIWGINIFKKDIGKSFKDGDIVMSLADSKTGAPIYYRLLRKMIE